MPGGSWSEPGPVCSAADAGAAILPPAGGDLPRVYRFPPSGYKTMLGNPAI